MGLTALTAMCAATSMSDLLDRLAVLPQYLWPQKLLNIPAGRCAAWRVRWWTRQLIPWSRPFPQYLHSAGRNCKGSHAWPIAAMRRLPVLEAHLVTDSFRCTGVRQVKPP